jgi:hypothetical protein
MWETVTRYRARAGVDGYTDATLDWSTPDTLTITTLGVEPRPGGEPAGDARNAVTSGYTLYLPLGADVGAADRVLVRGRVFGVLGEPAVWQPPGGSTGPGGVVVQTTLTEG